MYSLKNGSNGLLQNSYDKTQLKATQILTLGQFTYERKVTVGTNTEGYGVATSWEVTRPHYITLSYDSNTHKLSTILKDYHGANTCQVGSTSVIIPEVSKNCFRINVSYR